MKRFFMLLLAASIISIFGFFNKPAFADGCYLCEGGGYVKYKGADTFDKRKKAKSIGCKVTGTTGSCSNPKGSVD